MSFRLVSLVSLVLLLGVGAVNRLPAADVPDRPNVIVILADDFGYECLGCNGSTSYKTPNLDKLAKGGTRFTNFYSQPLCTPTRVQLMTGLYNVRERKPLRNNSQKVARVNEGLAAVDSH